MHRRIGQAKRNEVKFYENSMLPQPTSGLSINHVDTARAREYPTATRRHRGIKILTFFYELVKFFEIIFFGGRVKSQNLFLRSRASPTPPYIQIFVKF